MGTMVVVLLGPVISVRVCMKRICTATGFLEMTSAALSRCWAASSSPLAMITLARRSRSAWACRAMEICIWGGRSTSFNSTCKTLMPQGSVRRSRISWRSRLMLSRSLSTLSSSTWPSTERRVVWASCPVA